MKSSPERKIILAIAGLCVAVSLITASNVATLMVLKSGSFSFGSAVTTTSAAGSNDQNNNNSNTPGTDTAGNATGTTAPSGTPGTPGSPSGKVTNPTGGKTTNGKPSTNAEIAAYYKTCLDKTRSQAKSATLIYDGATNYKGIVKADSSVITSLGKTIMGVFMKAGPKNEAVKPADLPPKGASCNLTANDVQSASCTESGNFYIVKITLKDETNPKAGSGTGSIVNVITEDQMTAPVKSYGLKLSNIKLTYYGANVEAKVEKSTGHIVSLNVDAPSILQLDAKVALSSVTGAQVGIECVSKYTIAY